MNYRIVKARTGGSINTAVSSAVQNALSQQAVNTMNGCCCPSGSKGNMIATENPAFTENRVQKLGNSNQSGHMVNKSNTFTLRIANTNTTKQKLVIFDPNTSVQDSLNISALPTGVTITGLNKNYDNLLKSIASRVSLQVSKLTMRVVEQPTTVTVDAQFSNYLRVMAGNFSNDNIDTKVEVLPSEYTGQQRHLDRVEFAVNFLIEPETGMVMEIEPETTIDIVFNISHVYGFGR